MLLKIGGPLPCNGSSATRYKAVTDLLYCHLNGEAVLLSLSNGRYYGMNSVAVRIWEMLDAPLSAEEIEKAILLEYDVELELCKQQVSDFLQKMIAEELVVLVHETAGEIS
jgi:hypothetical protein